MSGNPATSPEAAGTAPAEADLVDALVALLLRWRLLVGIPLLAGALAVGLSYALPKTYTSRTVFLPPQQQQSAATAVLAQLGALGGLAGTAAGGVRTPGDQYVALLTSQTVADRLVDAFSLMQVYDAQFRFEARKELAANSRISLGRREGLITIEVDDRDPARAAAIANRYVEELRRLSSEIALTEAQQRRKFLEQQLALTRDRLATAQSALQSTGFTPGALKADARVAAEGYARARAEVSAAEVRLNVLRARLAETTPEVQQALSVLVALRAQLTRLEAGARNPNGDPDYVSRFREFKYHETLFDLFARQYEVARVDEGREGALIQVVDPAMPAEHKSRPKRAAVGLGTAAATALLLIAAVLWRHFAALQPGPSLRERLISAGAPR